MTVIIIDKFAHLDLVMFLDEKWATVVGLTYAKEKDLKNVREFVLKLEPELVGVFDSMWAQGDKKRLEKIAEMRIYQDTVSLDERGR